MTDNRPYIRTKLELVEDTEWAHLQLAYRSLPELHEANEAIDTVAERAASKLVDELKSAADLSYYGLHLALSRALNVAVEKMGETFYTGRHPRDFRIAN